MSAIGTFFDQSWLRFVANRLLGGIAVGGMAVRGCKEARKRSSVLGAPMMLVVSEGLG